MRALLADVLPAFRLAYPSISLDVEVRDGPFDLVSERFDAGIRIGEFIEPNMVAIKLNVPIGWIVVGSPKYFEVHGTPRRPADLAGYRRLAYRFSGRASPYRWEFREHGRDIRVDPHRDVVVTDSDLLCAFAVAGLGLAYLARSVATAELHVKRLAIVLDNFMPPEDSLYLYFPARSQSQPKLRVFIDFVNSFQRRNRETSGATGLISMNGPQSTS